MTKIPTNCGDCFPPLAMTALFSGALTIHSLILTGLRQAVLRCTHSSHISEITMQLTRTIYVTGLVLLTYCSFAQTTRTNKVNTSAAEAYFKVADAINSDSGEENTAW
jgi:hypothetical protein